MAMNAYARKEERSKIHNMSFHLGHQKRKYELSRRKEIRMRGEINQIEINTENKRNPKLVL